MVDCLYRKLTHAAVVEAAADAFLPWILVGHVVSEKLLEFVDFDTLLDLSFVGKIFVCAFEYAHA